MLSLEIDPGTRRKALEVLCLGAHCDDIDIGCGATLLHLLSGPRRTNVTWVTFSGNGLRQAELKASARAFLAGAKRQAVVCHDFRDGFFPAHYAAIKERFEGLKQLPRPDVIFSHRRDDAHQDHRVVSELTWNTFRDHLVLEYEIPKYEGDLVPVNCFVGVSKALAERKIRLLLAHYRTQRAKRWFTADTFRAVMRLRGIESGAAAGWAEGFHSRKLLLS